MLPEGFRRKLPASRPMCLQRTLTKLQTLLVEPDIDNLHAASLCLLASVKIFGVLADRQTGLSDRQVGAVADFIEAHISGPISLNDLASVAGLSRCHFSRSFKAATAENPHSFVQKRRIARAARLLQTGDMSLEAVALAVGYLGAPQFRRVERDRRSSCRRTDAAGVWLGRPCAYRCVRFAGHRRVTLSTAGLAGRLFHSAPPCFHCV